MFTDSQFKVVQILYRIIGCILIPMGISLLMSDIVRVQVFGPVLIACAGILLLDVRISKIERKLRLAETEKKQIDG